MPISALELYIENPRLPHRPLNQQDALSKILKDEYLKVLGAAKDIAANGLDPLSVWAVSKPLPGSMRRIVYEGNRRLSALLILENPSRATDSLSDAARKKLDVYAAEYRKNPVTAALCAEFDDDGWRRWVKLKHTGENEGAGVVPWGRNEQDEFLKQEIGRRPAGQVLDFLYNRGIQIASPSGTVDYASTLDRLLATPEVRELIGLRLNKGSLELTHSADAVAKVLTLLVDRLRDGTLKVGQIMEKTERVAYVKKLPKGTLPSTSAKLPSPIPLGDAPPVSATVERADAPKRSRAKSTADRKYLIPSRLPLNITDKRTRALLLELQSMDVEKFKNAVSFSLRVFVEMSCDSYIDGHGLRNTSKTPWTLGTKLTAVSSDLETNGLIDSKVRKAIHRVAGNSSSPLAVSVFSMHEFVHNRHVFPTAKELRLAWDELEAFFLALWP